MIEIDIPGWEKKYTTFARIPDLKSITKGYANQIRHDNFRKYSGEIIWAIAERLGFSICRRFTQWYKLQPAPDIYNLEPLEQELKTAKKYGIDTWLCLYDPPPFAFNGKTETYQLYSI